MQKIPVKLLGRDRSEHHKNISQTLGALELINKHEKDDGVTFIEEGHKYYIDGVKTRSSCTGMVGELFKAVDSFQLARYKMMGKAYKNGECVESGMSMHEIVAHWKIIGKQSADLGTEMHANIEFLLNARTIGNEKTFEFIDGSVDAQMITFETWWNDFCSKDVNAKTRLIPYRTEWLVYDKSIMLAGSIDALFKSRGPLTDNPHIIRCENDEKGDYADGEVRYHLLDWKRSKEINKKSKESGADKYSKIPNSKLINCNFGHYSLQLNIYRKVIESYGMRVASMALVVIHPNFEGYKMYSCPFLDLEADYVIKNGDRLANAIDSKKSKMKW